MFRKICYKLKFMHVRYFGFIKSDENEIEKLKKKPRKNRKYKQDLMMNSAK